MGPTRRHGRRVSAICWGCDRSASHCGTARVPLDPHLDRLFGALSFAAAGGSKKSADILDRRASFRKLMELSRLGAPVTEVESRIIPGPAGSLPIRVYTPLHCYGQALPGLIYLHGGGFVCGDLETHDPLCRTTCDETGCRTVAVDYRLAPEHPFPAAVQDAYAAADWVINHAHQLRIDPTRIAIAGDSAGATLAAVVCHLMAEDRPGALALQLLLCPILDWTVAANARRDFGSTYLLDRHTIEQELAWYLPAGRDPEHPHISPVHAADFRGQPPTHIHTAEFDPVRDDGRVYADKLQSAGVAVCHTCHGGMVHMFYGLTGVVPYARVVHKQIGAAVRAALSPACSRPPDRSQKPRELPSYQSLRGSCRDDR